MKKRIRIILSVLTVAVISLFSSDLWSSSRTGDIPLPERNVPAEQQNGQPKKSFDIPESAMHKGVIRVKLTEEAVVKVTKKMGRKIALQTSGTKESLNVGISTLNERLAAAKATKMKRVFPYHSKYEARQQAEGLHLWYEIQVDADQNPAEICEALSADVNIKIAEPVLRKIKMDVEGDEQVKRLVKTEGMEVIRALKQLPVSRAMSGRTSRVPFAASARNWEDNLPVNDPYIKDQWHYYNYGQIVGDNTPNSDPNADIDLFDAWQITMGDPRVIVSVHDQGVDYRHPDLAQNMWVNEKELNGMPGVDDDGNGYVDDIYGYNFFADGPVNPGPHGTHVSGTIAAVNNNGIGVCGIAGGNGSKKGVRIMSCQILDQVSNEGDIGLGAAVSYVYAANNGAVISQNSWGYSVENYYDQADLDGIDYFIKYAGKDENGKPLPNTPMVGGIVIFSAGNDGMSAPKYPGYYDHVLSVAATGPWNEQTNYTNYGDWVDIAAPGGNTDVMTAAGVLSTSVTGAGQDYGYMQGTSMACPHVSGVAALILSKFGHESYTPEMLWNRLIQTAVPWSEIKPEHVGVLGVGLVNAARAVQSNHSISPDSIGNLKVKNIGYDFITVSFTAPKDQDNGNAHAYEVRYSKEPITEENISKAEVVFQLAQKAGTKEEVIIDYLQGNTKYYAVVRSTDIWGNRSKMSNQVEAATSTAPKMAVDPKSLNVEISHAASVPVGVGNVNITNLEGGDLRYSMKGALTYTPEVKPGVFYQKYANCDVDEEFTAKLGEDGSARFVAATRFNVVKKPFLLTQVSAAVVPEGTIGGKTGYLGDTIEMKLYLGGATPTEGHLVSRMAFVIPSKYYLLNYGQDLYFDVTPYLFETGEHFWIVFDFSKGFSQPMRINSGTTSPAGYELYSGDGEKWTDINTLNIGKLEKNYAYRIFPLSDVPALPEGILSFEPQSGFVTESETKPVKVNVNASKLVEGDYTGYVSVFSNDPNNQTVTIPLKFSVAGQYAGIRSVETFSLGSAVQGYTSKADLVVYNDSLGILKIDTAYSSLRQYTIELKNDGKDSKKIGRTSTNVVRGDSAVYTITFHAPVPPVNGVGLADSIGNFISRLTFETNAANATGGKHSVILDALSIDRPVAVLDRNTERVDLSVGQRKEVAFTLKNEGKYRLDYTIGKDMIADYDYCDLDPAVHEYYGKRSEDGVDGATVRFASIEWTGTNVTENIKGTRAFIVPIPFTFMSYGVKYDTLTLFGNGIICLGARKERLSNAGALGNTQVMEAATIFPSYSGSKNVTTERGGQVFMKIEADKVIVEYTAVGEISKVGPYTDRVRVQTVLYANGNVQFYHQYLEDDEFVTMQTKKVITPDLELVEVTEPFSFSPLIGISDPTGKSGLGIHSLRDNGRGGKYVGTGDLDGYWEGSYYSGPDGYEILSYTGFPAYASRAEWGMGKCVTTLVEANRVFAKDVTPMKGSLLPGEETRVVLALQMDDDLSEGEYKRIFPIKTNDPLNKDMAFEVTVNWTAEAKPELLQAELNYGSVGKDVPVKKDITLKNLGGKSFKAKARLEKGVNFKLISPTEMTECKGMSAIGYTIEYTPVQEIDYSDRLIIEFEDPAIVPLSAILRGKGAKRALLEVEPSADMDFRLVLGGQEKYADTAVILKNAGDAVLKYNMATSDWIKKNGIIALSGMDKTGYFWSDNDMDKDVSYDWVWENPQEFNPLGKNATGQFLFSKEFDLPWNFPFYGESFNKCYVDMSGMISFSREDIAYSMACNTIIGDNVVIPQAGDRVNGFITAMGGSFDLPHMYHEVVGEGEDQRVVFTFSMRDLMAKQDTTRALYQAILYPDGRIKFQYKDVEKFELRRNKTIGIENRTGEDGLSIAYCDKAYIKDRLAIMIAPTKVEELQPGEKRRIALRVTSDGLMDGSYNGKVYIRSNDPRNPVQSANVNLELIGKGLLSFMVDGKVVDKLDFGNIVRSKYPISHKYEESKGKNFYEVETPEYKKQVIIRNNGTRKITVSNSVRDINNQVVTNLRDNFPMNPFGPASIDINPKEEFLLQLRLSPFLAMGQLDPHEYTVYYILQDKCETNSRENAPDPISEQKCKDAGYVLFDWNTSIFGGKTTKYYYKKDTLDISYNLFDVPNERFVSDKNLYEFGLDGSNEKESFDFTVSNSLLPANYWQKMHHDAIGHSPIVRQSDLKYDLSVEDLTAAEYAKLLKRDDRPAAKASAYHSAPVVLNRAEIGANAAMVETKTTQAVNTYIDSLGYFNSKGLYGGYTADGKGMKFITYVRYYSGKEGFNLTHVKAMMAKTTKFPEEGFDYEMQVLMGKNLDDAEVIYSQVNTLKRDREKQFLDEEITLEKPVYVYPDQYFWVAVVNKNNTMIASVYWEESLYTAELKESFAVDNESYRGLLSAATGVYEGWAMACYSTEVRENPTRWISVSQENGNIVPGGEHKISVSVDPSKDLNSLSTRYAKISLGSNDSYPFGRDTTMRSGLELFTMMRPDSTVVLDEYIKTRDYILVKMRINQAPEFVGTQKRMTLNENVDSTFIVKVVDVEGDKVNGLTVKLDSAYNVDKKYNMPPVVTVGEPQGQDTLKFPVTVKTNYESEGSYAYTLRTTDSKNQEREFHLTLIVENVNRAPQVVGVTVVEANVGITKEVNLNKVFSDPDRQSLQYTAESGDQNLAAVTVMDSVLSVHGWKESTTTVKVTAIDPESASKAATFNVKIVPEDPATRSAAIATYPNPVVDVLNCSFAMEKRGEVVMRIFGSDGRLFYESDKNGYAEGKHEMTINVSSLPGGLYVLQYVVDGSVKNTTKFVK